MRILSEKEKTLLGLYKQMAAVFDKTTDELKALPVPPGEQASMQVQLLGAVLNDYVGSLPGATPEYIKQIVDYVFECRAEVYRNAKSEAFETALSSATPPSRKDFN